MTRKERYFKTKDAADKEAYHLRQEGCKNVRVVYRKVAKVYEVSYDAHGQFGILGA